MLLEISCNPVKAVSFEDSAPYNQSISVDPNLIEKLFNNNILLKAFLTLSKNLNDKEFILVCRTMLENRFLLYSNAELDTNFEVIKIPPIEMGIYYKDIYFIKYGFIKQFHSVRILDVVKQCYNTIEYGSIREFCFDYLDEYHCIFINVCKELIGNGFSLFVSDLFKRNIIFSFDILLKNRIVWFRGNNDTFELACIVFQCLGDYTVLYDKECDNNILENVNDIILSINPIKLALSNLSSE